MVRFRSQWLACGILFLFFSPGYASLDKSEKVKETHPRVPLKTSELFERISESSSQVKDLSAQVNFHLNLSRLGMHFNVGGDFYYKKPDKFKLKLREVPDFLVSREDNAFRTTNLLASLQKNITQGYDARVVDETSLQGANCYVIRLIPKTKESIQKIVLWVNSQNYTMPKVILSFDDGSTLVQRKQYIQTDNIYVVQDMETDIDSPDIQAEIITNFSHYQINKGIPDTVFDNQKSGSNPISAF